MACLGSQFTWQFPSRWVCFTRIFHLHARSYEISLTIYPKHSEHPSAPVMGLKTAIEFTSRINHQPKRVPNRSAHPQSSTIKGETDPRLCLKLPVQIPWASHMIPPAHPKSQISFCCTINVQLEPPVPRFTPTNRYLYLLIPTRSRYDMNDTLRSNN